MKTSLLRTNTRALFDRAVARTVELLQAGGIVALPTETVYGLAANAFNAAAVGRVFEVKGRPSHNPIIVHVASLEMARRCARIWPPAAEKLAASFWPGPLTMVLPRSSEIPDIVAAGGPTVGLRWPGHPFMQEVISRCGFPLAAPSANPASGLSPTNAEHVLKSLDGKIPLIIDGGQSQVGIESTVVDLAQSPPRVLRPGMISEESLRAALGSEFEAQPASSEFTEAALRSPGQLARHYSPRAKMVVLRWNGDSDLERQLSGFNIPLRNVHVIAHAHLPSVGGFGRVSLIPHDPEAYARAIYAELHRCDEAGAQIIVVEAVPDEPAWQAIADRLRRGSAMPP